MGLCNILGERDLYLDGVISLANPQTYRGCENKSGSVAELWARRKNLHAASVFAYLDDTIMAVPPEIAGASLDAEILSISSRDLWKQQTENIHLTSSRKHDLPGFFENLSRPASLSF